MRIIAPTGPAALRSIAGQLNIQAYGAIGDGVTDDTLAIQAAITTLGTAGGTLTGPKGTYLLSRQGAISHDSLACGYCLKLDADATHGPVTFEFPLGTVFKLADSQPANSVMLLLNGATGARRTGQTVLRGITFDGNYATQTAWTDFGLICSIFSNDLIIEQCVVKNFSLLGIHTLRDSYGVRIVDNVFDATQAGGVTGRGCVRIEAQDIVVDRNSFFCDYTNGCSFLQAGDNADAQQGGRGMRITNNEFCGGYAGTSVDLGGVSHVILEGNYFRDQANNSSSSLVLQQYTAGNTTWWESFWNIIRNNVFVNVRNAITLSGAASTVVGNTYTAGAVANLIDGNMITRDFVGIRTSPVGSFSYPARVSRATGTPLAINLAAGIKTLGGLKTATNIMPVTGSTSTTLVNAAAGMTTNAWQGMALIITGGAGKGQVRKIVSHTATTFTVIAWDTTPDTTSTYAVGAAVGLNTISNNKVWATSSSTKAVDNALALLPNVVRNNESFGTLTPYAWGPLDRPAGNLGYSTPNAGDMIGTHLIYQDENKGTATIASGATTVVVTHKLGWTPTAEQVSVMLTNNPTVNPGNIWVDTITSTQFTINVRTDPGTTGATLAWRAAP